MGRRITTLVTVVVAFVLLFGPAARPQPAAAATYSNTYLLRERLCLLQAYVERYANQHYSFYPTRAMVRRGGPLPAPLWPLNPWTGGSMVAGSRYGDYSYTPAKNLLSYRLSARYPGGTMVLRGSVPATRKMQNDHRTREGLELVRQFIEMWARGHDDLYPSVAQVDAEGAVGLQAGIRYWPHDPWTHEPMKQSTAWGNFTYSVNTGRDSYVITAHYSRGGTFTLRGARATNPWHVLRVALQDATLRRDLEIVDTFVRLHAATHGGAPPAPDELSPAGVVGQENPVWPVDPYSGEPFTIGSGVGRFAYAVEEGGSYTLSAALAGEDVPYVIHGDVTPGLAQSRRVPPAAVRWGGAGTIARASGGRSPVTVTRSGGGSDGVQTCPPGASHSSWWRSPPASSPSPWPGGSATRWCSCPSFWCGTAAPDDPRAAVTDLCSSAVKGVRLRRDLPIHPRSADHQPDRPTQSPDPRRTGQPPAPQVLGDHHGRGSRLRTGVRLPAPRAGTAAGAEGGRGQRFVDVVARRRERTARAPRRVRRGGRS